MTWRAFASVVRGARLHLCWLEVLEVRSTAWVWSCQGTASESALLFPYLLESIFLQNSILQQNASNEMVQINGVVLQKYSICLKKKKPTKQKPSNNTLWLGSVAGGSLMGKLNHVFVSETKSKISGKARCGRRTTGVQVKQPEWILEKKKKKIKPSFLTQQASCLYYRHLWWWRFFKSSYVLVVQRFKRKKNLMSCS